MEHHPDQDSSDKWVASNPLTNRYEEVFLESELLPGETVLRLFWHRPSGRYITIPGASLYTVDANHAWVLAG